MSHTPKDVDITSELWIETYRAMNSCKNNGGYSHAFSRGHRAPYLCRHCDLSDAEFKRLVDDEVRKQTKCECTTLRTKLEEVERQRNVLMDALEKIAPYPKAPSDELGYTECRRIARAAIDAAIKEKQGKPQRQFLLMRRWCAPFWKAGKRRRAGLLNRNHCGLPIHTFHSKHRMLTLKE